MTLIKSISGIRGIIDKSLDSTMVAKYVQAFSNISPHGKILLARDTRNSGKDYIQTAIIALKQINRESIVVDIDKIFKAKGDFEALSGIEKEKIESIIKVNFEIKEFNKTEKAKLEKSLFDKIYKENTPKNQTEFKTRVKEEIEKQFVNQSDQKFLNDVTDELIKSLKIDLPEDFIKKLIKINSKDPLTDEDIQKEYDNSKNGLKYQLIESKLLEDNNIKIDHLMIKDFAEKSIKNQMIAYGQPEPKKEDLEKIFSRILSNEEDVKRMTHQLISEKLLSVYKEKINKKVKETTYEKYIELAYKKND